VHRAELVRGRQSERKGRKFVVQVEVTVAASRARRAWGRLKEVDDPVDCAVYQ